MAKELDFGGGVTATIDEPFTVSYTEPAYVPKVKNAVEKVAKQAGDEKVNVSISKQRRISKATGWAAVFPDNMLRLMDEGELKISKNEMRILFKLIHWSQMGNLVMYKQKALADELNMNPSSVCRSIANLIKKRALIETARGTFINPLISCHGSLEKVKEVMGPVFNDFKNQEGQSVQYEFRFKE